MFNMDITNAIRKLVYSLSEAKHRRATGLFKVEGTKGVVDMLPYFDVEMLLAERSWLDDHAPAVDAEKIVEATGKDLERMSHLKSAPPVIAVLHIPKDRPVSYDDNLVLALDCVQDPGNLGTIIRTADWFGVHHILASTDTADVWAPKVVQATMGSLSRVKVHYCNLANALADAKNCGKEVYGTFLGGDNLFTMSVNPNAVIVMGNEGRGISEAVGRHVTSRITIPSYPTGCPTAESLNVAIATAITVSQFRSKHIING